MDRLILQLYSFQTVVMLACAAFYFKAADMERASPILWAGLSLLVYLLTWMVLGWGMLACLGGQVGLLVGIAIVRAVRERGAGQS